MAFTFESIRDNWTRKDEPTGGNNNYYPFFNMEFGEQAEIRFLPDVNEDNPRGFLIEKLTHKLDINGEKKNIPCLKMYGDDNCPICKLAASYYKRDDKINGGKYWRKKQYLGQVLVVDDPLPANKDTGETHVGKVRIVALGPKIYDSISESFKDGDLEDLPFLYEGGTNFAIKKSKQGDYADYSRSKFVRSASDLDPDVVEAIKPQLVDLATLLPKKPELAAVEAMLEAHLNGTPYQDGGNSKSEDADEEFVPSTSAREAVSHTREQPAAAKVSPAPAAAKTSDATDADAEALLASIRQRRANRG